MGNSRRLAGACILSLAAALTTGSMTAASPVARAAAADPPRIAKEAPLRIATFNTEVPQSDRKAMRDITALAAKLPDVLTLQEMSSPSRRRLVREQLVDCETCLYDAFMPSEAVPGGTPILYRSDRFTFLGGESLKVTNPTYVGKKGAGPSTMHSKYVNYVRLRDNVTMRKLNIFNNHAVPSVQGANGGPNLKMGKRLGIYEKHMRALVATLARVKQTYGGFNFVTGDLNVNFRRDRVLRPKLFPYRNMGLAHLRASFDLLGEPARGTHVLGNGNGSRLIDYVYADTRRPVRAVGQQILMGYNSDHRPVLVDFKVRYIKPYSVAPPVEEPAAP